MSEVWFVPNVGLSGCEFNDVVFFVFLSVVCEILFEIVWISFCDFFG